MQNIAQFWCNFLELLGSGLGIFINYFANFTVEMRKTYEKEKHITLEKFFISTTLEPLSGYHNLISNQCTSFYYLVLVFFHTED